MLNREKIQTLVEATFALDLKSPYHGVYHWSSVGTYGMVLAGANGADTTVVQLFALLHDSRRYDEDADPQHGKRAAQWVKSLWKRGYPGIHELTIAQLAMLVSAIESHSDGYTTDNVTVGTCWDADRLDLGRVGIMPAARLLSTHHAKDWLTRQPQLFAPKPRGVQVQAHSETEPAPAP